MNNYNNEIPIIKKIYELYKIFYGYSKLFPKKDKYTLGSKCEMYIIDTLELLLAAGSAPRIEKQTFLKKANIKFDALKIFIRLTNELGILDNKKYLALQHQIQEIGRMLGGWQRSLN
ncbi:MAG: four helix bundle protein [Candidatus Doudnabacteria bacterium]